MSRKLFTEKQQQLLRQNPYIYSVTDTTLSLTKEFKEIFMAAYKAGESPRTILENHGFDINLIGERRIWSISQRIREEYKKYGEFHEGYSLVKRPIYASCQSPIRSLNNFQSFFETSM